MYLLEVDNLCLRHNDFKLHDITFNLSQGECLCIIGASGSGKSTLLNAIKNSSFIISGQISEIDKREIAIIAQQNSFKDNTGRSDFYYQQRFDSAFSDDNPTVEQELSNIANLKDPQTLQILELLKITNLLDENLIKLSNGESKKLQIAKALFSEPKLLLLDNPFVGLDSDSCKNLCEILDDLRQHETSIIIVCSQSQVPYNTKKVLELKDGLAKLHSEYSNNCPKQKLNPNKFKKRSSTSSQIVVELKNINISYDNRQIIKNFSWKIFSGEKWLLSGANGAGKSTILSLINADNPQAYANEIFLFGNKRGSGESIWEIKNKIGFFSPEFHLYFDLNLTLEQTLASGFSNSLSSKNPISDLQSQQVEFQLSLLGLTDSRNKSLYDSTFSKQRLALIGRAIIKNPDLLILDEPCQGLDTLQVEKIKQIVDSLAKETTLIYVTHNNEEIPSSINCFLEIEDGQVKR